MIDLFVAVIVVASLFTGYLRGVARELLEFVALLIGLPIAFRLGPPIIESLTSLPPINASLMGGVIVLLAIMVIAAMMGRAAERAGVVAIPDPTERVAGAAIGFVRSLTLMWVLLIALSAMPAPAVATLTSQSSFAGAMAGPEGVSLTLFTSLTGQDDVSALVEFNRRFPDGPVISDDYLALPAFDSSKLTRNPTTAREMLLLVNGARGANGAPTLMWSDELASVAERYANELYSDGFFAHESARSGTVGDRVLAAGIEYGVVGENLALAPTLQTAHDGLMGSPGHRANILGPYAAVGIGAVQGPLGLIIVQVFHA